MNQNSVFVVALKNSILQVGANKSKSVTQTSSLGMWVPVHDNEWDGDIPLRLEKSVTPGKDSSGYVTFKGDALPWFVGQYEVSSSKLL